MDSQAEVVLITGAASLLVHPLSVAFARRGVRAIVLAASDVSLAQSAAEVAKRLATNKHFEVLVAWMDDSDANYVHAVLSGTVQRFGKIDICVNLTELSSLVPYSAASENAQARGLLVCLERIIAFLKVQRGTSCIVNLSAPSREGSPSSRPTIEPTESAIARITQTAALSNREHNIRVNAIIPTNKSEPIIESPLGLTDTAKDWLTEHTPIDGAASMDEICNVFMFLSFGMSGSTSGACVPLSCGLYPW